MTVPAWDLDAPAGPDRLVTGSRSAFILLLAVGLAGLGLGGLAGSTLAPAASPELPATGTLKIRDVHVNASSPLPTAGSDAASDDSKPRIGKAIVVFRLNVVNPGNQPVKLTGLALDGVTRTSYLLPLNVQVASHGSIAVDLTAYPDCSPGQEPVGVRARLNATEPDGSDLETIRVAPARTLSRIGGLCSQLNVALPNGWQAPLWANSARPVGPDLEITMDDLSSARLDGIRVDDQLLPTVFIGDQLFPSSAHLRVGETSVLRLHGPPPCIQFGGSTPIPSTARLLVRGEQGMQQRLLIVGPELALWLRLDCD
ncbi:MAG TPA: hypothetical protein VLL08_21130 [Kineosporiaceae bacterium]|nr:hypothetical protein [Kineosporiaceae bacterium]